MFVGWVGPGLPNHWRHEGLLRLRCSWLKSPEWERGNSVQTQMTFHTAKRHTAEERERDHRRKQTFSEKTTFQCSHDGDGDRELEEWREAGPYWPAKYLLSSPNATSFSMDQSNVLERKQECSKVWKFQRNHILMLPLNPFLVVSQLVTLTLCLMSQEHQTPSFSSSPINHQMFSGCWFSAGVQSF